MKASNVQHEAPIKAIKLAKLGMAITITPVDSTTINLKMFWKKKKNRKCQTQKNWLIYTE